MMSFWRRPFRFWRVESFPDTYGVDREAIWHGLREAIERQRRSDDLVLLVAHFPATYFELQDRLAQWQIAETPLRPPIRATELPLRDQGLGASEAAGRETPVVLVLAEMLDAERPAEVVDRRRSISIMAVERHPLARHDRRLEQFARSVPTRTRLGFFVSLEDDQVGPFLGEWTGLLLQQLGMRPTDLITSDLISRRMLRIRERLDRLVRDEQPCESPREWLERHLQTGRHATEVRNWLRRPTKMRRAAVEKTIDSEPIDEDDDDETTD